MSGSPARPSLAALRDYVFQRAAPIGISNRHIHLSGAHVATLFGAGQCLTRRRDITQRGQYSCEETLTVATPKGVLREVRVMGPARPATQVELAASDLRRLGLPAVLRASGDARDTPGCVLIGPRGTLELQSGVIVPERHLHMAPRDAAQFGVGEEQRVRVAVPGPRGGVLNDVLVRIDEHYVLELHLDTDEAHALLARAGDLTYLIDEAKLGIDLNLRLARPPGGRRLMTESDLRQTLRKQGRVRIPPDVLLTPSARDLARRMKLG